VEPDICVICDKSKIDEKGCAGAPDWIIEILSPASSKKDLNEKFNLYEENGVKEYWVVFPDSNVINQYVLTDGVYECLNSFSRREKARSAIFPDMLIDLKDIF
jgi:Uma2 family endonuclease